MIYSQCTFEKANLVFSVLEIYEYKALVLKTQLFIDFFMVILTFHFGVCDIHYWDCKGPRMNYSRWKIQQVVLHMFVLKIFYSKLTKILITY